MPRTLEPNSPAKRLAYVLKTYQNQPWVVAETASIVAMMIGVDRYEQWIDNDETPDQLLGEVVKFIRVNIPGKLLYTTRRAGEEWVTNDELGYQQIIEHLFDLAIPTDARDSQYALTMAEPWNKEAAKFLVELLSSTPKGKADHPADGIIPWIAQQVSKLFKARAQRLKARSQEEYVTNDEMIVLLDELHKKSNAIAAWAKANRKDIGKVTLAEALEGAKDFEVIKVVPQGAIIYRFADGYTIQMLRTKEELANEGEVMQHCVGSYCEAVFKGASVILSLRDDKGQPHVTMEWSPDWDQILYDKDDPSTHGPGKLSAHRSQGDMFFRMDPREFIESPLRLRGHFAQIYGKQNEPPTEKYQAYIREFIREKFDGEPQAMLMSGADPKEIRFMNRTYNQANFSDLELSNTDWSGSTFEGVDFKKSNLEGAKFRNCIFTAGTTSFEGAVLKKAEFDESIEKTKRGRFTHIGFVSFVEAQLQQSSFDRVQFIGTSSTKGADFTLADLSGASLRDAALIGCDFTGADLSYASFDRSNITGMILSERITYSPSRRIKYGDMVIDHTSFEETKGVPQEIHDFIFGGPVSDDYNL